MSMDLATAYVSIVPSTRGLGKSIRKEFDAVQGQADKAGQSMGSKLSDGLKKSLKGGAVAAGATAGGILARSLTKGFQRLDAIDQAKAKFKGLGLSAKESASVMDDVTAAVKGTSFATSEAADAAAMALAAGVKPGKELTGVLTTIGDAAAFAGKDFSELSPIFTKVLNEGKVTGETLAQLGENAVPAVAALSKELGVSTEEVSKLASAGKISWDDFKAAMDGAIGGQALMSGETFRGSLKNLDAALGRLGETILSTPFKMGPQVFSAIGRSIDGLNDKAKAVIGYLQTGERTDVFTKAFGDPAQADAVVAKLDTIKFNFEQFMEGLRGNNDAEGMFGSLGESVRKIGDAFTLAAPSIGRVLASLGEAGMAASVVSITAAFATLAPLLADILVPVLETLANIMQENQGAVNALVTGFVGFKAIGMIAGPVGKVAGMFTKGAGAMKLFSGALATSWKYAGQAAPHMGRLGKVWMIVKANVLAGAKALTSVKGPIGFLARGVAKLWPLIAKVGGVIAKFLVRGLTLAAGAFKALGVAMLANPIVAIIAGVVAAGAALWAFFTKTEKGREIWASFTAWLSQAWETVKTKAVEVWNAVKETVVNAWNGVVEFFSGAWASFTAQLSAGWESVKQTFSTAWEFIKQIFSVAWNAIVAHFQIGWTIFTTILTAGWEILKAIFTGNWDAIKQIFMNAWNTIQLQFTLWWMRIQATALSMWVALKNLFSSGWEFIKQVFVNAWNAISGFITGAWNNLVAFASNLWNRLQSGFADMWNKIKTLAVAVWNYIKNYLLSTWDNIKSMAQQTFERIRSTIQQAMDNAKNAISNAWNAIKSAFSAAVAAVIAKATEFARGIADRVGNAIGEMQKFPAKVGQIFANAGSWLLEAGKNIIRGLINGIKSMGSSVWDAISSVIPAGVAGFVGFSDGGVAAYARGGVDAAEAYANGGRRGGRRERHVAQIAKAGAMRVWAEPETGGEAYIPLARGKRRRSTAILADVAGRFGLNLTDKDGNPVSKYTPGGTGHNGDTHPVRFFANGGVVTAGQLLNFAKGMALNGNKANRSLEGAGYGWGGGFPTWGDCSGTSGALAAAAIGKRGINGRYFFTGNQSSVLSSWGFRRGLGTGVRLAIGHFNGGPYGGHTSSTIFFGGGKRINLEMGGGRGNGQIGGAAAGADHSQYTDHHWFPLKSGGSDDGMEKMGKMDIPTEFSNEGMPSGSNISDYQVSGDSAPLSTGGGATNAGDAAMVPLDAETQGKVEQAGMDSDLGDTWSDVAGNLAKTFVSGHIEDILGVFGIPNELPPILKAGKQLFTRQTDKNDPTAKKEQQQIADAADAVIEAEVEGVEGVATDTDDENLTPPDGLGIKPTKIEEPETEKIRTVPIGQVTSGPYKLGHNFYAEEVARAAAERGMGFKAAKIAWATVMVESGDVPKMYANRVDPASLKYPHEAIGADHDSSGLFQQRNNGAWGTIAQRMNARASASMFLNALAKVPNWRSMDEGAAAQAVQRSAFPSKYATKMGAAANVMSRFKGKLPGFKNGGLVKGGKSKTKDDILAMLQNGEMVINRKATEADPEMAATLNEQGPDAVRANILADAAEAMPKYQAGQGAREWLSTTLHGGADLFSQAVESSVSAGFGLAGNAATSAVSSAALPLNSIAPGLGSVGSMLPIDEVMGFAGDITSWYTGQVSSGIGHAFADLGLGIYDIGIGRVEEFMNTFNLDPMQSVPMTEGMREFNAVAEESFNRRADEYAQRTGTGDTFIFNANNRGDMESMYRREMAKRSRGKVGAR